MTFLQTFHMVVIIQNNFTMLTRVQICFGVLRTRKPWFTFRHICFESTEHTLKLPDLPRKTVY